MKKFNDLLYLICNSNELNIFDSASKKILRTVLFQDQNITAIHITDKMFLYADHSNFIYAVKLTDLEVREVVCLTEFPEPKHGEKKPDRPQLMGFVDNVG